MVKRISTMLLSFFIALALFMPENADAAKCQGLSGSKCKSNANCVWVSGYKRKGTQVKSYCRSKPTRSKIKKTRSSKKKRVTKKRRVTKKKSTAKKKKRVVKKRKAKKKTTKRKTRKKKK